MAILTKAVWKFKLTELGALCVMTCLIPKQLVSCVQWLALEGNLVQRKIVLSINITCLKCSYSVKQPRTLIQYFFFFFVTFIGDDLLIEQGRLRSRDHFSGVDRVRFSWMMFTVLALRRLSSNVPLNPWVPTTVTTMKMWVSSVIHVSQQ